MKTHDRTGVRGDTTPEVQKALAQHYRAMPHRDKLEQVAQLTRAVQEVAVLDLRRRYPQADARELQLRLASRWLDPEFMRRYLDWDPDAEGR